MEGTQAKNTDDTKQSWEDIYQRSPLEELPWEENRPTAELVALIESGIIRKGTVLDVGCGSGNNVIYLATQGFVCHGIDIAPTAITYARQKASKKGARCELITGNTLQLPYTDNTFTLVFDRGCFHSIPPPDRQTYIRSTYRVLKPSGKYQLICFSTKDHRDGPPYAFSPKDIQHYFSPLFKIHHIQELSRIRNNSKYYFLSVLMEKFLHNEYSGPSLA